MNLTYVYADNPREENCSRWNCFYPAEAVNRTGIHHANIMHVNQFSKNSQEVQDFCKKSDILIIERNLFGDALAFMTYWRVRNKSMIAIFDDGYDCMTEDNPAYAFWHRNQIKIMPDNIANRVLGQMNSQKQNNALWNNISMPDRNNIIASATSMFGGKVPMGVETRVSDLPFMGQFKWGLGIVKGIQVPSKRLADDWKKYNKTYYVPNYLDIKQYLDVEPLIKHDDNEIFIGWCGSLTHLPSFVESGAIDALKNIFKKYKNVKLLIGGDKKVFDAIDIPEDKKIFQKYVPHAQWTSLLKSVDIGLAPLATVYDRRRSWVKAIEYMALKTPWIASNFPPYKRLHEYGTIVKNSIESWENGLVRIIDNLQEYRDKAAADAYDFALTQTTDKNILNTIELYQKIIDTPYKWPK